MAQETTTRTRTAARITKRRRGEGQKSYKKTYRLGFWPRAMIWRFRLLTKQSITVDDCRSGEVRCGVAVFVLLWWVCRVLPEHSAAEALTGALVCTGGEHWTEWKSSAAAAAFYRRQSPPVLSGRLQQSSSSSPPWHQIVRFTADSNWLAVWTLIWDAAAAAQCFQNNGPKQTRTTISDCLSVSWCVCKQVSFKRQRACQRKQFANLKTQTLKKGKWQTEKETNKRWNGRRLRLTDATASLALAAAVKWKRRR